MSVRTGDRSDGTLGVLNDIANLGAYTIQICRSEKVFPKSSRWVMAKPIVYEQDSPASVHEQWLHQGRGRTWH